MKKFTLVMLVLLATLALVGTAGAGAPASLTVIVRNSSGGEASLRLTDADGNNHFFTVPAGASELTLTEGIYTYYAIMPCGNTAGTFNINVAKVLYLSCQGSMPMASVQRNGVVCENFGVWDYDFQENLDGFYSDEPDFYLYADSELPYVVCLDPYYSFFKSIDGWQVWERQPDGSWHILNEDPFFF